MQKAAASGSYDFNHLLREIGDFGRFQIFLILFISIVNIVPTWSMLVMMFAGATPGWTCAENATISANDTVSLSCSNSEILNCTGLKFEDDMRTIVSEWNLICDRKWITQTITTIQMIGQLVGEFVFGHAGDTFGRKPIFYFSVATLLIANLTAYFSVSWEMFATLRFCIGFFAGGLCCAGTVVGELLTSKWRLNINLFQSPAVWAGLLALFCWRLHDWRFVHLAVSIACVPILLTWRLYPESFRWYIGKGRYEEAEAVLRRVARVNRKTFPDLTPAWESLLQSTETKKQPDRRIYTFIDLFRNKMLMKLTVTLGIIWLASAFGYYGITFSVQLLSGNLYLNMFIIGIIDYPGSILIVLFNRWGGRRWTSFTFYLVSGAASLGVGIMQYIDFEKGWLIQVFAVTSKLFVSAAWGMSTLWCNELYPTVVRRIGGSTIESIGKIGSMIAPQILTLSYDLHGLLYLTSGGLMAISAVACIFLKETKDLDLQDTIKWSKQAGFKKDDE
ncbi:hypothetical protein ACJMK2_028064 [Sinanodonta woodiana]|uniref:Major facilitator superfamily (MFS) profile domain-containing protein n=1 Tax=Sinanodonta woodiana TaxID=1069815 RepID=A0ABD3X6G4_SINWO